MDLDLPHSTSTWNRSFLSGCSQRVRMGLHTSAALSLSTGSPQGCVLSPLLYILYTYDCTSTHHSNNIVKYADDTTVVGLISGVDQTGYREETERMTAWCRENNLLLNTSKTKQVIIDFRRKKTNILPLYINGKVWKGWSFWTFPERTDYQSAPAGKYKQKKIIKGRQETKILPRTNNSRKIRTQTRKQNQTKHRKTNTRKSNKVTK